MIVIKFVKTCENAILPQKNNEDDACYDLFAVETVRIPSKESRVVPVGLKVGYITPGYWFRIEARSGNGFKKSLEPHPGIIDNGYRGDLGIKLFNLSDQEQVIEEGKGVAQFSIQETMNAKIDWIDQINVEETVRGESGFGSSDKKNI